MKALPENHKKNGNDTETVMQAVLDLGLFGVQEVATCAILSQTYKEMFYSPLALGDSLNLKR